MRIRFSVRDLFWLTLVAAIIVAWAIDHKRTTESAANNLSNLQARLLMSQNQSLPYQFLRQPQIAQQEPERPIDNMPIMRPRRQSSDAPIDGMPIIPPPNRGNPTTP